MKSPDEQEVDRFFEQLARREPVEIGTGVHDTATALREALRSEAATLLDAKQASLADLSSAERMVMSALKQRLLEDGVLGRPQFAQTPAAPAAPREGVSALSRWRSAVFGDSWWRPMGFAASAVLAGLLVLQLVVPDVAEDHLTVRGGNSDEVLILDADPASRAEALALQLRDAGATVVIAPISASERVVVITVEDANRGPAVQAVLSAAGAAVAAGQPGYRLSIRAKK